MDTRHHSVSFIAAVASTAALHAAVFLGLGDSGMTPSGDSRRGRVRMAHVVVREAEPIVAPRREDEGVVPAPPVAAAVVESLAAIAPEPPVPVRPADEPAATAWRLTALTSDANEEYVEPRQLSVRPTAIGEIALPQPSQDDRRVSSKAVLTLFIDADGRVVRIRVESSDLPREVEGGARQAFLQAHFRPGMIDGSSVKSRMTVEVVFDTGVVQPAASASAGFATPMAMPGT